MNLNPRHKPGPTGRTLTRDEIVELGAGSPSDALNLDHGGARSRVLDVDVLVCLGREPLLFCATPKLESRLLVVSGCGP